MAFRQSGGVNGGRNSDHVVSIASRGGVGGSRHHHHRRSKPHSPRKISIGFCILTLSLVLSASAFFYFCLQARGGEVDRHPTQDDDTSNDTDFLLDVTRLQNSQELKFGHGSTVHGRDSRYWDKDDRRRDGDYSEEELERTRHVSDDKLQIPLKSNKSSSFDKSHKPLDHRAHGLYNEAGRNELKMYEAEYEASLKSTRDVHGGRNRQSGDNDGKKPRILDEADDYDDGIDIQDDQTEEYDDARHDERDQSVTTRSHNIDTEETSHMKQTRHKKTKSAEEVKSFSDVSMEDSFSKPQHDEDIADSDHSSSAEGRSVKKSSPGKRSSHPKPKPKRRKFSGSCEMKMANSSGMLIEPLESKKFARFSLQYTKTEERPVEDDEWEPRFAGHQSLTEREDSFIARDQKINCGFVKGPKGSPSTGFDLAEDDAKYISSCHIAVMSCIFGNSDHLRSPAGKAISRLSRKNVCFVMFVDELTIQTLSSEGQMPDSMGYLGFWKIVVVKNLPYTDMRRVGKIPKLLPHRLFPSARYSIWLDSKLRLQHDPLLILEYFLWRKGHEYAISNHYDRHCLWEEVAQNKRLNKYNHTVIDEQFAFYQADGMQRFNASDPNKLLPSNVPEGSFIVRAHTPMSNLFSCLWFNEVERFTPRDQLSFAYTYHKLRKMNPEKPFYLNMFKDCERRKIAKLFRHRSEDPKRILQQQTE